MKTTTKQQKCVIFVAPTVTVSKTAIDFLQDYIHQVTGETPELRTVSQTEKINCSGIIIGNEKRNVLTKEFGIQDLLAPLRDDGYILKTFSANGHRV
ncbi:MAG: hypothetical protein WCS27_07965, partial [Victivallaceae bacterium]